MTDNPPFVKCILYDYKIFNDLTPQVIENLAKLFN